MEPKRSSNCHSSLSEWADFWDLLLGHSVIQVARTPPPPHPPCPHCQEGRTPRRVMKIRRHLSYMLLAWSFTVEELDQGPPWESPVIFQDSNREMHNMKQAKSNVVITLAVRLKLGGYLLLIGLYMKMRIWKANVGTKCVFSQLERT